jgi:hypothetical protein
MAGLQQFLTPQQLQVGTLLAAAQTSRPFQQHLAMAF